MANDRDGAAPPVDLVTMLVDTWASLDAMLGSLGEAQWKSPTQCPGWSVQDTVSHLIATERMLAGDPSTSHRATNLAHTRNPIGEWNEHEVDARRSLVGAAVLAEWRDVVQRRTATLRAMSNDDLTRPMNTPTGPGTLASFLELRVMDCWVHEVDIRRALGLSMTSNEASARHALQRFARSMQIVVGKRVAPPDGTSVCFDITGRASSRFTVAVRGRRAEIVSDAEPEARAPSASVMMDSDVFTQLACGRRTWTPRDGDVTVTGDRQLAEAVLSAMNVMI